MHGLGKRRRTVEEVRRCRELSRQKSDGESSLQRKDVFSRLCETPFGEIRTRYSLALIGVQSQHRHSW